MKLTKHFRIRTNLGFLKSQARKVNFVWNYCNDTQRQAAKAHRRWLFAFDFNRLTAGSAKPCHVCGVISGPKGLTGLNKREWDCSGCGTHRDRDVNAACNILAVSGLRPLLKEPVVNGSGHKESMNATKQIREVDVQSLIEVARRLVAMANSKVTVSATHAIAADAAILLDRLGVVVD